MPEDSFVLKFFVYMKDYLSVGPPVYFVVNNTRGQLDFSRPEDQNLLCSSLGGCEEDSLTSQVFTWQKASEDTRIATAPLNWVNDYLVWIHADNDVGPECCKIYNGGQKCINETTGFYNKTYNRPSQEDFRWALLNISLPFPRETISWFLQQNPGESCPSAGHAAYWDAVGTKELPEGGTQVPNKGRLVECFTLSV